MAGKTFQQNTKVRSQIRIRWRESKLSDRRWFCNGGEEEESKSVILSYCLSPAILSITDNEGARLGC